VGHFVSNHIKYTVKWDTLFLSYLFIIIWFGFGFFVSLLCFWYSLIYVLLWGGRFQGSQN